MMKYNRETDTLLNMNSEPSSFTFKEGDFYFNDVLSKIENAHKYINQEILEKMTEKNDYIVKVDRIEQNSIFNSLMKPVKNISWKVTIYKKVVNLVPKTRYVEIGRKSSII